MFNIGMWALFRIAFRTEKYLVRACGFPKDVNNICRQQLIFRNSSLNKLRIEYNWVKKFSSNIYSYERGRKYSTLEFVLFSKLLFERRSIWSGHRARDFTEDITMFVDSGSDFSVNGSWRK